MPNLNLSVSTDESFIDTRQSQRLYNSSYTRFMANPEFSDVNKELVRLYLRDASLGKTMPGRQKKKIGYERMSIYINHLTIFLLQVKKDLNAVTLEDMETFIEALENDRIRARRTQIKGEVPLSKQVLPYSPRFKVDIKHSLRKFYKWLLGNNRIHPPLVEWIDTSCPEKEIAALSEQEVKSMVMSSAPLVCRALIQVLFDGGFRISELLNIRLRHVSYKQVDPAMPAFRCFVVRVPFSKTLRRTVTLPMTDSAALLQQWLQAHPGKPRIEQDGSITAERPDSQLFPLFPDSPRAMLRRIGLRCLRKRVYPHLLRHSSATYWCSRLSYFQLCKRFGWSMTSKMPQRYIDREGLDDLESARIYQRQQVLRTEQASIMPHLGALDETPTAHQATLPHRPPREATTGMLINKHVSSQTQYGGVQDDKPTISDHENASGSQRAEQRHASGHAIYYQPAQRGQRTRRVVHGIPESHCCQTATGCTSPSQSTWSGQVQAGSTKGISPVLPAQVRQGRRYSVRSSSKPPARQCFSACCNPQ